MVAPMQPRTQRPQGGRRAPMRTDGHLIPSTHVFALTGHEAANGAALALMPPPLGPFPGLCG